MTRTSQIHKPVVKAGHASQWNPVAALPPGDSLDPQTRSSMEALFDHDFSRVRIHTDARAAESADELQANAYTVGQDIVFGPARYAPHMEEGQGLIAHELAHVLTPPRSGIAFQKKGDAPLSAEEEEEEKRAKEGKAQAATPGVDPSKGAGIYGRKRVALGTMIPLEDLLKHKKLEDVKASSQYGGIPSKGLRDVNDLLEIMPELKKDASDPKVMEKAQKYFEYLQEAFQTMGIDTIEAQALFLAHATVESNNLRQFTEMQIGQYVEQNPSLDIESLEKQYPREVKNDKTGQMEKNKTRETISPGGNDWTFIGRGALQVTHRENYLRAIAVLNRVGQKLFEEGSRNQDQAMQDKGRRLIKAAQDILDDPKNASKPENAFLFSAAFAKDPFSREAGRDFEKSAKTSIATEDIGDPKQGKEEFIKKQAWMTGGGRVKAVKGHDPEKLKYETYQRALDLLRRINNVQKPQAAPKSAKTKQ